MKSLFVPLSLLALTAVAGCSVQTSNPPPVQAAPLTGVVTIDWTIDGNKDPAACSQSVSSDIDIKVYDSAQNFVGEFKQACSQFATTITLDAGSYTADAALVDGSGQARTTTININPFTLHGNDTLSIPVDFPANSFR